MKRFFSLALVLALLIPSLCAAESLTLAEGAELRIMSYNIMHPDWSRVSVQGRDEIVADILRSYRPDVAAIQEAGAKWHKALIPLLVDTGEYAFACRKSNAEGFVYCCTTFLYNPRTVKLVDEYILDLDFRDAARVFSIAVFERLNDGAQFVVTNTHPAPRDTPDKYARNMEDLTSFAASTVKKYEGLPVILAGDFNTPDQTELYLNFMNAAGVQDAKYEADVLAYDCSTFFGYQEAPNTESRDLCVDHLFVNDQVDVKLFSAIIDHDAQNASDHIPICADIALK